MQAKEMKKRMERVPDDYEMIFQGKVDGNFVTLRLLAQKDQKCILIRAESINLLEYNKLKKEFKEEG